MHPRHRKREIDYHRGAAVSHPLSFERRHVIRATLATGLTVAGKFALAPGSVSPADLAMVPAALVLPYIDTEIGDDKPSYSDSLLFSLIALGVTALTTSNERDLALAAGIGAVSFAATKYVSRRFMDTHHLLWARYY